MKRIVSLFAGFLARFAKKPQIPKHEQYQAAIRAQAIKAAGLTEEQQPVADVVLALIKKRKYKLAVELLFGTDLGFACAGRDHNVDLMILVLSNSDPDLVRKLVRHHSWQSSTASGDGAVSLRVYAEEHICFRYPGVVEDFQKLRRLTGVTAPFSKCALSR